MHLYVCVWIKKNVKMKKRIFFCLVSNDREREKLNKTTFFWSIVRTKFSQMQLNAIEFVSFHALSHSFIHSFCFVCVYVVCIFFENGTLTTSCKLKLNQMIKRDRVNSIIEHWIIETTAKKVEFSIILHNTIKTKMK